MAVDRADRTLSTTRASSWQLRRIFLVERYDLDTPARRFILVDQPGKVSGCDALAQPGFVETAGLEIKSLVGRQGIQPTKAVHPDSYQEETALGLTERN